MKSNFIQKQEIETLGFVISFVQMKVSLTSDKKQQLKSLLMGLLNSDKIKTRKIACVIVKLISTFSASAYGPLYFRQFESDKVDALKISNGNFYQFMTLSNEAKYEISWWLQNIDEKFKPIQLPPKSRTMLLMHLTVAGKHLIRQKELMAHRMRWKHLSI